MGDEVDLRVATESDAEAIFAVHRDSVECLCRGFYTDDQVAMWLEGRSLASYRDAISRQRVLVATTSKGIVGFIEYAPGEIVKLFIRGSAAGKGVGGMLLRAGLAEARRDHSGPVRVESTRNAQGFYERFGFVAVDEGLFSRGGSGVAIEVVNLLKG
jgi:predicted N-acetyltransferase YhbS